MKSKVLWQAATLVEGECARCGGLLLDEIFRDHHTGEKVACGLRCANCGYRTDKTGGFGMAPPIPENHKPGPIKGSSRSRRKFTAEAATEEGYEW